MVQRLLPIALAILASVPACGPSPGPRSAAPGPTVRRADPTPPPEPGAVAEPEEPAPAAPAAAAPAALADACEGAAIDLHDVFDVGVCQVEGKGDRIPPSIRRSIEPAVIEVSAGRPARAAIRLENTGSRPADVFLSLPCELEDQVRTWIEDPASGKPVDTNKPDCEGGSASADLQKRCLATVHQIRMPPGGTARFPFEAATSVRAWDDRCETHRGKGAVPRGRYKLRVRALFLGAILDADLVVR
ncbi:MAG TPA: hypothetical protein VKB80_13085 [Kofleriaceae bacterium]|nr:hypothetical protein [Kofleriaceae bacterium]